MWPTTQQPIAWTLTHRIIMILYFLTFWSYISFSVSGYNVLVTIFGNVHRPCRHYFIIVNNSLYHVYYFFPHFLAIFTSLTILGNAHRPCKQCINIIKRVYIISSLFSPDFFCFSYYICINYYISTCSETKLNNTPTLWKMVYVMLLHSFVIFSWWSGHICFNYHIRKCAQTM